MVRSEWTMTGLIGECLLAARRDGEMRRAFLGQSVGAAGLFIRVQGRLQGQGKLLGHPAKRRRRPLPW